MLFLDLTFDSPTENLAADETLLDLCEDGATDEILRFWEPKTHFVVLGYGNRAATEANLEACRKAQVPVLRRASGGGTVLQGPGCLNYALVLKIPPSGPLASLTDTNCHILQRHRQALVPILGKDLRVQGVSDLTRGDLKFSGNAQRRKRRCLLFHGTFLLHMDLSLVEKLLPMPSRRPDYRADRPHGAFLTNVNVPAGPIKEALKGAWGADAPFRGSLADSAALRGLADTYASDGWNRKF